MLVQRLFGVLFEAQGILGGFDFSPIRSSLSLEIWSTPYGLELLKRTLNFHTFHPKLIYIFLIRNCVGESNEKTKSS